jgi:hypothetical protein
MNLIRRRFTAVAGAALLLLATTSATFGLGPSDEAHSLRMGAALNFRSTFGYPTDLELVSRLERDPKANRKYSVALAPHELADMNRRMDIQNAMAPLVEYAHRFPDSFGGIHVDQTAGGVYYFSFTSGLDARRRVLDTMAPAGVEMRYRTVARTEAEVDALVERISRDLGFHSRLGVTVHVVGSDTARNGVDVNVEPYSPEIARALEAHYGAGVRVLPGTAPELTACVNRDNCDGPPIMAGVSNDWGCTVGFGVHGSSVSSNPRFLTAGHCIAQVVAAHGWSSWTWFHHITSLGRSTAHSWYDFSTADAGTMGNVSMTVHSRRVMKDASPTWYRTSSRQGAASDYQGFAICQSGQTSGLQCGTILSTNKTPNYSGVHMTKQRQANYMVQMGDSGAPVVSSGNRTMAVGLQSGRDSLYVAYYSHIGHVQAELGQFVRITDP